MTPLNLYLEQANDQQMRDAIEEYGTPSQLAAANIFPGDSCSLLGVMPRRQVLTTT